MQDFGRGQPQTPATIPTANVEVLEAQIVRLLGRMKVAVVFGGQKLDPDAVINPTTNPRSWKTYESVPQDIVEPLRRSAFLLSHPCPPPPPTPHHYHPHS